MQAIIVGVRRREALNSGKLVEQKAPFELKQLLADRIRLLAGLSVSPGGPRSDGKAPPHHGARHDLPFAPPRRNVVKELRQ